MTGSDCVQAAFRIMRGVTGRQVIIRFEKHYSGWYDNVLGGRCQKDPNARPTTDFSSEGLPEGYEYNTLGRSKYAGEEVFMLPWNDFDALERTFEKYHDEIAGVHFEAVVANNEMLYPKEGYLEKIRELCTKYGAIMSIDEVITGFRVDIGGARKCSTLHLIYVQSAKRCLMDFLLPALPVRKKLWTKSEAKYWCREHIQDGHSDSVLQ